MNNMKNIEENSDAIKDNMTDITLNSDNVLNNK